MTALSASRRSAAGIAFLVGGALLAGGVLLGLAGIPGSLWFTLLANVPLAVGFGALAFASPNLVARGVLLVAAAGFVLIVLSTLLWQPVVGTVGVIASAAGAVVGAILLLANKALGPAGFALLVSAIIYAAVVLPGFVGIGLGALVTWLMIAAGAGLLVTGVLLLRSRR